jgi:hypothetical protein
MKLMTRFYKFSYLAYILMFSLFGFFHPLQASNEGVRDVPSLLGGLKEHGTPLQRDRKDFEKSFIIKGGPRDQIVVRPSYED